ncbi:hypothetical protein KM043_014908 [Ampulex compressa]|nr:hypothetical protein KM043_014908 [Ampulex compressa]
MGVVFGDNRNRINGDIENKEIGEERKDREEGLISLFRLEYYWSSTREIRLTEYWEPLLEPLEYSELS